MIGNTMVINNAAGLAPERSMVLPERKPQDDEQVVLDALVEVSEQKLRRRSLLSFTSESSPLIHAITRSANAQLYASAQPNEEAALRVFASDVIYSTPCGDVFVGHQGLKKLLARATSGAKVHHRLLQTPEILPTNTMVIDQIVVAAGTTGDNQKPSTIGDNVRSLLVLKRRQDGMVSSMSEEAGHRRATAPLAARSASANNFYSPTDSMVSPCTSKLNLAKRKHHTKAKPMNLFANHEQQHQRKRQPGTVATDIDF